jgi:L-alanine-DL-glutamate epimerase-like enolase superfamily enzyme
VKLSWQRRRLKLRHPFNIARRQLDQKTDKEVLLVEIEHQGCVGRGEAAPISYYNQSLASVEETLGQVQDLVSSEPDQLDSILDALWQRVPQQTATIAAIDGALHDLCAQLRDQPVWQMLGIETNRVPLTSLTIGIDSLDTIATKVQQAEAFPILKVKLGTDQDADILDIIRAHAPEKTLRIDANCGWTSQNLVERGQLMRRYQIELIEQPVDPSLDSLLASLDRTDLPPIIADESCALSTDITRCASCYDGINIKLSKCGGIREAHRMIQIARESCLSVMLGCMVETSVGIAAALQLAPLVDYLDLDGHLLLANDPFEGIGGEAGRLELSRQPGSGIRKRQG